MTDLLNELPDTIFVPLGRRGFHPINLKSCIKCSTENIFVLEFLEKIEYPAEEIENSKKEMTDYKVKCRNCGTIYYIRKIEFKRVVNGNEERLITNFNIIDKNGNDEGWLGSVYE
ncbi:MAG: hypothetical protein ACTSPY_10435 [Candidatus Helarchaeota archaeon]